MIIMHVQVIYIYILQPRAANTITFIILPHIPMHACRQLCACRDIHLRIYIIHIYRRQQQLQPLCDQDETGDFETGTDGNVASQWTQPPCIDIGGNGVATWRNDRGIQGTCTNLHRLQQHESKAYGDLYRMTRQHLMISFQFMNSWLHMIPCAPLNDPL